MANKPPVKQSPKPAAGKKSTPQKDEAYATEKIMDYYR